MGPAETAPESTYLSREPSRLHSPVVKSRWAARRLGRAKAPLALAPLIIGPSCRRHHRIITPLTPSRYKVVSELEAQEFKASPTSRSQLTQSSR